MDKRTFERFRQRASTLTVQQVRELAEMLRKIDTRTEILSKIDARAAEIDHCPHCGSTRFGKWGSTRTGLMRLRCSDCLRTFSSATNTVVNRVRMTETFHEALSDMFSVYPLSCRRLAEQLGVHHMTIWRWRHRILDAVLGVGSSDMNGIVEADEKFFKESRKGSREWVNHLKDPENFPSPPRLRWKDYKKKKIKNAATGWQMPVLTIIDRSGGKRADVIPKGQFKPIIEKMRLHVSNEAVLCTDGDPTYRMFAEQHRIPHYVLSANSGQRVVDRVFHIQTVNSLHQRFNGFMRPFKGPATKYLPKYSAWFIATNWNDPKSAANEAWKRILLTPAQHGR